MKILLALLLFSSPAFAEIPPPASEPCACDDCEACDDCDACDDCENCDDLMPPPPPMEPRNKYERGTVKGFGFSVLGGGDLRVRDDLARYGAQLGPAGDPTPLGGMITVQAYALATRYLRVGGDFTYTNFSAAGTGPDASNVIVRQTANYEFVSGGALFDGVLPIGKRFELSLGAVIGGGRLGISTFASRIDNFNQLGTSLGAIAKTESVSLNAPFFEVKPELGLHIKANTHFAIDLRAGVNFYFVAASALSFDQGLSINASPAISEIEPFVQVGFTIGDWLF